MDFDPSQPIWLQLLREFTRRIATDEWSAGSRIPSVRELAAELSVNPNTVQRALAELERERLSVTERTAGRFVTSDQDRVSQARLTLAQSAADLYVSQTQGLGLKQTEATSLIKSRWNRFEPHEESE